MKRINGPDIIFSSLIIHPKLFPENLFNFTFYIFNSQIA